MTGIAVVLELVTNKFTFTAVKVSMRTDRKLNVKLSQMTHYFLLK